MSQYNQGDIVRIINKYSRYYEEKGIIIFDEEIAITVDFPDGYETFNKTCVELVEKARFQYGDYVQITDTNHPFYGQYGSIRRHYVNGDWKIQIFDMYVKVKESVMKPVPKENNADTFTKIKIDEITGISIKEENKTMKRQIFVRDIFNRVNNYITLKQGEALNVIQSEDTNWKEAQMCMKKLKELHDYYYPEKDIAIDYYFGLFCSPTTMSKARAVNERKIFLESNLYKKQELITHALQVDENMSSEAVFKLLNSYGLTDGHGKVLPITEGLICDLLELPEGETLF